MKTVRTYAKGEIIFSEKEQGQEMYILVSGAVELKKKTEQGETLLKVIDEPNDFFGEMALIDERPRSATARAVSESRLFVVDRSNFDKLILSNGSFSLKVIRKLSEHIRNSNKQISELVGLDQRERCYSAMVDFALQAGERLFNKGYKVAVPEMNDWINRNAGIAKKDVERHVYRLIKANRTPFASTASKSKDAIILPEEFINYYERKRTQKGIE